MTGKANQLIKNIDFSKAVNINSPLTRLRRSPPIPPRGCHGPGPDGRARITIDGEDLEAEAGQAVVMPANVPHGVYAATRFKMLLIVINRSVGIQGSRSKPGPGHFICKTGIVT